MINQYFSLFATRREALKIFARAGIAAAAFGKALAGSGATRAAEYSRLPIGMNLAGIADWARGYPFLNVMWGARIWLTKNAAGGGPWDTGLTGQMELDADGYPLEIPFRTAGAPVQQVAFTILPNTLTAGKYVILHDGEGQIVTGFNTRILKSAPGRIEIYMAHGGGEQLEVLEIRKSTRGNHIRNIRILPLEQENADLDANPFRPEVIEFCKPWHCLRFMDWLGTNDSINQTWSGRKKRSFYTQTGANGDPLGIWGAPMPDWQRKWSSGIAIDLCIQLANITQTDAWLCVPHLADDDYILQMAKLVKEQLDPELKVYLEFSNEMWNWQFQQAQWMIRSERAGDLVTAAGGASPWKNGSKPSEFRNGIVADGAGEGTNHPERTAALFRRCFGIWESVFQGADRQRLVRVCGVQLVWLDTVKRTLDWVMANGGCDALSPTGYFGPNDEIYRRWEQKGAALTANDVIEDMEASLEQFFPHLAGNARYAEDVGVDLIVYEGGQHIQPQGQAEKAYNAALGQAQKHPRMYDLYRRVTDRYAKEGCTLFCAFNSVSEQGLRWGSWGHAEYYGQSPSEMPKYRAILDANVPRGG